MIDRVALARRVREVRTATTGLATGLCAEDCLVQSSPDASPIKWHLAHTTWFFEAFVLGPHAGVPPADPRWAFLFNSYYESLGSRQPRSRRGDLSRPTLPEVTAWRDGVDRALGRWILEAPEAALAAAESTVELGLHHEQQHQELILTDLKHHFWSNPLRPVYRARPEPVSAGPGAEVGWLGCEGGLVEIGAAGPGFSFDNERPRHRAWLAPHELADRLVTCSEWLAFMADGGYADPLLWLSDGWAWRTAGAVEAPLYWERDGEGGFAMFTLAGRLPVDPAEPVCHVSAFEADAFARWSGARLPTEFEWEHAFATRASVEPSANLADRGRYHPERAGPGPGLRQGLGDAWEWTSSAYGPYPGYRAPEGAFGEYNGKFMCNQLVLRGASCATPASHARITYRNFFYPRDRWQFTGVRLARDRG
jgi:ergothioneine biosynthesis protein EgtB